MITLIETIRKYGIDWEEQPKVGTRPVAPFDRGLESTRPRLSDTGVTGYLNLAQGNMLEQVG
jgi:hypothetical protein